MKMRITLPVLLFLVCAAAQALAWEGRTKLVHDGDSITVSNPAGELVHIRLYGIDAPELKQSFGYQARKRMIKLASRKTVEIESVDLDRYGRTVALVRLPDGTRLNEVMVAEGLAWVYDEYCRQEDPCARLRTLQDIAQKERRGLWAEDSPERPADWRREHKTEEWYKKPVTFVKSVARKVRGVFRR